ncbi:MAG TPA: CGNR zinc finger domain-containing protein [Amycolatopsis sp.]|jgi:predicted RNA-binding Zn ribbon-like protein
MEHAFPCENPALDFVGTLRARRNAAPLEKLGSADSLDAWFVESGTADARPDSTMRDLTAALSLREAIYSLVAARLRKQSYVDDALKVVNRAASRPPVIPRLTPEGRRVAATTEQALSTIARAGVEILGGSDAALLKECGRPECTQVYLDRSRGFRREWCSMITCGNKMKAAAYRARRRGNQPSR